MDLVAAVASAWGWTGIHPSEVVKENDFGNLIVKDRDSHFWRISPEDLSCSIVADSRSDLDALLRDPDFLADWNMKPLVAKAQAALGPLAQGHKYCLKIPALLGGEYDSANLGTISLLELIQASGDMAKQVADVPDGSKIRLHVTE
jgi:hypothetical protein